MKTVFIFLKIPVALIGLTCGGLAIAKGDNSKRLANGAAASVQGETADFEWEFSIRDSNGKSIRTARMKAEGTSALRDKERGSCMYKFMRKETLAPKHAKYFVEETCAISEEMARGNATVSSTNEYGCQTAREFFDAAGVQSCASTVDTRTGKQFHCECRIKVKPAAEAAKQKS